MSVSMASCDLCLCNVGNLRKESEQITIDIRHLQKELKELKSTRPVNYPRQLIVEQDLLNKQIREFEILDFLDTLK